MSTTATVMPPPGGPTWIPSALYRLTVDEYQAMVAAGAFRGRQRLNLVNGLLVERMTQNPPHVIATDQCHDQLVRVLPPGWHVRSAHPVVLPGQASAPEPDQCVVRGTKKDYLKGHPGPADIALVAEVADSSLTDDRAYAVNVYGPAGIPVYWIVNLIDRQVEVYTHPQADGYGSRAVFGPGQTVPVEIDGRQVGAIAVDDLLP